MICPQNDRILHENCPNKYFPIFFLGGARASPLPPVSYAYAQKSLIWQDKYYWLNWDTGTAAKLTA